MKHSHIIATVILILSTTYSQSTSAGKPAPPKPDPVTTTSEAQADARAASLAAAAALSRSNSDADAYARTGDSSATGGAADANAAATGGNAGALASTGPVDASSVVDVATGAVDVQTGAVTVDGDTAITTISYDFPAEAARVLTNECQDGSAAQTRNFGINVTKMNPVCLALMGAKAKIMMGSSLRCDDVDALRGPKAIIPTPNPTECERLQRQFFHEANALVDDAMSMIDRQGFVKRIWRKIW